MLDEDVRINFLGYLNVYDLTMSIDYFIFSAQNYKQISFKIQHFLGCMTAIYMTAIYLRILLYLFKNSTVFI